jgi:DNA-binding GntR family transcriptional regulator
VIYLSFIATRSKSTTAYLEIRRMIVRIELAPGAVIREDELQDRLRLGRTPIREALQRLVRDQFVTVMPRRGMYVSTVNIEELPMLYDTRLLLEPYAVRLACDRGNPATWDEMESVLDAAATETNPDALLAADRRCREIVWAAAGNRFLVDTLDMLYAHSDRLWHLYLSDVADFDLLIGEHRAILTALKARQADRAAALIAAHMTAFNDRVRAALEHRLRSLVSA